MKIKNGFLLAVVMLGALLAGCAGTAVAETPATDTVPEVAETRIDLVAEAEIEPVRWTELVYESGGEVTEVLVGPGDRVAAGAPLVRLDVAELEISLQSAQQDVVAKQAALALLVEGASQAQIERAAQENAHQIAQAEVALRVQELELERARAQDPEAEVTAARDSIEQIELELAQSRLQDPAPDLRAAQIDLERAQIALDETQDEYNKALDRPWEPQKVRDGWAKQLKQAELDYARSQTQLDRALNAERAHAAGLAIIQARLSQAEDRLQRALDARQENALALETQATQVEAARLELRALRAWSNPYLDKASEQEITQARVRVRQAELAADQLALQISNAALHAPPLAAGTESVAVAQTWTVIQVHLEPGDRVSPGAVGVVLATLDRFQARTRDLMELDVSQVAVGQPAVVTLDALPGQEFAGIVREVSLRSSTYRGDIVYDVFIDLPDLGVEDGLRWGMTAMVVLEPAEQ